MNQPNWSRLYQQGRVKDIGVRWNPEEKKAIYERGMDPEDVRKGYLTPEDKERAEKEGGIENKDLPELIKIAKEKDIDFDKTAVNRNTLIREIRQAEEIEEEEKDLEDMKRHELLSKAKEVGAAFTNKSTKEDLKKEIRKVEEN